MAWMPPSQPPRDWLRAAEGPSVDPRGPVGSDPDPVAPAVDEVEPDADATEPDRLLLGWTGRKLQVRLPSSWCRPTMSPRQARKLELELAGPEGTWALDAAGGWYSSRASLWS